MYFISSFSDETQDGLHVNVLGACFLFFTQNILEIISIHFYALFNSQSVLQF